MRIADSLLRRASDRLRDAIVKWDPTRNKANTIGDDWRRSTYYDFAEQYMSQNWELIIWPMISDCDFTTVVDLATGHGRNAVKLAERAQKLWLVDITQENIDFCRRRFAGDARFSFVRCDGVSLQPIPSSSVTLVYSFDAMVHFDSDTVRSYLREFARVLQPGGRGFCHHSNYTANPTGEYQQNPHWRNFMSRELFEHWCHKEGLRVVRAKTIDWDLAKSIDCVTVFERPR